MDLFTVRSLRIFLRMSSNCCLFLDFCFCLWDWLNSFSLGFSSIGFFDFMTSVLKAKAFINWFLSVFEPLNGARRFPGMFLELRGAGLMCRYLSWFSNDVFWGFSRAIGLCFSWEYWSIIDDCGCKISYHEWLDLGLNPSLYQFFPLLFGFYNAQCTNGSYYFTLLIIS